MPTRVQHIEHTNDKHLWRKTHFRIRKQFGQIFCWNFEVWAVRMFANLQSCRSRQELFNESLFPMCFQRKSIIPTRIFLHKSASIRPRASLSKFEGGSMYFSFFFSASLGAARELGRELRPCFPAARRALPRDGRARQFASDAPKNDKLNGRYWVADKVEM